MIFQIKRLFLKDRKNILSRPNQMDKDDKVILIKELAFMPVDGYENRMNDKKITTI